MILPCGSVFISMNYGRERELDGFTFVNSTTTHYSSYPQLAFKNKKLQLANRKTLEQVDKRLIRQPHESWSLASAGDPTKIRKPPL